MTTQPPAPDDYRPLPMRRIALGLIGLALGIVVISLVFLTAHQRTTGLLSQNLHTVFWYFDVGREYNVATWFNSGLWLLMGVLAVAIALFRPPLRRSWWLLAVVALFASIDEYLEVHERLDVPGNRLMERLPFDLGFSWVLLGAPLGLAIALLLLRLVLSLPSRARAGIVLGGALFLVGALGVETLNGLVLARHDGLVTNAFLYGTMIEELCEMSGLSIALAALLGTVQRDRVQGTLRLDPAVRRSTVTAPPPVHFVA
ncbi:hypothetical protein [Brachybacterium sp. YJGR34]|uniref:hypothetical protein n=1 Tax=Brachybacterium sp. YJGR34 TaxID=2059911 RepID=UPI000E0C4E8F|nr:hypothetical protein [Brachybacterium sp. YJGR34]